MGNLSFYIKRIDFAVILLLMLCLDIPDVSSQVVNRALALDGSYSLNFISNSGNLQVKDFTVQMWVNVDKWKRRSKLIEFGGFCLGLSDKNKLYVSNDANFYSEIASDADLSKGWWHITVMNSRECLEIFINGKSECKLMNNIGSFTFSSILVGEKFVGRIDELRLWNACIPCDDAEFGDLFIMRRNTVNKWHPYFKNLKLYAKFDGENCIVDNSCNMILDDKGKNLNCHAVYDNKDFDYKKIVGYISYERWANGNIDRDKFLLVNDLIVMALKLDSDGVVKPSYPEDKCVPTNYDYIEEFKGKRGLISLKGKDSYVDIGNGMLEFESAFSFGTWLYIDEWTEDGYIFLKKCDNGDAFSLKMGKYPFIECNKPNGKSCVFESTLRVGKWQYVSFSMADGKTLSFLIDGKEIPNSNGLFSKDNNIVNSISSGLIGFNMCAKFDETWISGDSKTIGQLTTIYQNGIVEPNEKQSVDLKTFKSRLACWKYDKKEDIGFDSFSYKAYVDLMRKNYEGYSGMKVRASVFAFKGWQDAIASEDNRKRYAEQIARYSEFFDGIDLDLEWCKCDDCWENYGKFVKEIKSVLPSDKMFTISPHSVAYEFPKEYMRNVDFFNFQMYGPLSNEWKWSTYLTAPKRLLNWGYSSEKMIFSFATTTSKGYDASSGKGVDGDLPTGLRYLQNLPGFDLKQDYIEYKKGCKRYITSIYQTVKRCELVRDNNFGGIMFWEMAQDIPTSHPDNLVKYASFSINSNVEPDYSIK